MTTPIRIHPHNPKLFEFRGQPRVLLAATEHYGAVMNRPFRYAYYLADLAEKGLTLTRLFLLFRELQSPRNPYSTCKPDSSDYVTPWPRTGPGRATDGELKYDLDAWNPEFFERLHGFLSLASRYAIVVEVTLFSNTYADSVWALNPLNPANNVNGSPDIPWPDYISLRHADLTARQLAYARKIVQEINTYDNIVLEVCNEPGGAAPLPGSPSPAEVNAWQQRIIETIQETEAHLPQQHLIVGQEAFTYQPWEQSSALTFEQMPFQTVNMHPLPNTTYHAQRYDMGEFMSKQLKLRALRDYCLATYALPKPLNLDEDNIASQYMDAEGWAIHRKRAWTALMSGAHYDYIDFSVNKYVETGSPGAQKHVRAWFSYLAQFIHSLDLVRARPLQGWLREQPASTLACVLGVEDEDYCIYLADERELDAPDCGESIQGRLVCNLPAGDFEAACYSPQTGQYSVWLPCEGKSPTELRLPAFQHDLVVRIRRMS
jgi:hypothetical protein